MPEYGYPKEHRLRKRGEYLALSRDGEKVHRKHFLCLYKRGCGPSSRLGVTVSRKVGNAVTRNRLKRMCREFFRMKKARLAGIWDINIIAKQSVAGAPRDQAQRSLEEIFQVIAEKRPSDNYC